MCALRSFYYTTLSEDVKKRYDEKIKIICDIDPYTLKSNDLKLNVLSLPKIKTIDLVNYLILSRSYYSGEQMKAYKSLEAYKYYEAGFVRDVLAAQMNSEAYLVVAKVRHSQRMNQKPLSTWIAIMSDGSISCAHCNCMAGLGEVCSHVAAVLFYLKARPDGPSKSEVACTDKLAQWPVPSTSRGADMMRIRDMGWSRTGKTISNPQIKLLEVGEMDKLLRNISKLEISPAIFRIREPYAAEMAEAMTSHSNLPSGLNDLYHEEAIDKTYHEILCATRAIDLQLGEDEIKKIEEVTRKQAKSTLWYKYRAGRITASKFKSVSKGHISKPSLSVVKGICYPQKVQFYSKQTEYGLKNEKIAITEYIEEMKKGHVNFSIKSVGFIISAEHSEFGASPDSVVNCDCCSEGCVEVKCPYTLKNVSLEQYVLSKYSCLSDLYCLKDSHTYYYQVQLQMYVTNTKYCDFVIWSKNVLFIQRITYNEQFLLSNLNKCMDYFKFVIKPELYAQFFTQKCGLARVELWCSCKNPDDGRPMLRCDNDECSIGWYHFDCMGFLEIPNDSWFCPICI